jgi:hypothetical protein
MDAVKQLHSRWLRATRGGNFADGPAFARVVIDGIPQGAQGDLEDLESLSANDIQSIRYLTASDATIRYGTGFPGGAIEVWFRRPG